MMKFKVGGRTVSSDQWVKELEHEMIDRAMEDVADQIHGVAASIVDPETGKHPVVRVRRMGKTGVKVLADGSDGYANLLNERLVADEIMGGSEEEMSGNAAVLVYLAHGSEDKAAAARLRDQLMERGIEVWFDEWEIGPGDSLVEKMARGLEDCTHFVVLLTPTSIEKPWVKEEMNAAFVRKVDGGCRFIGLRADVAVDDLHVFLRAYHVPEIDVNEPDSINSIADAILGISRKPTAAKRQYVRREKPGLEAWSEAAAAVARVYVEDSEAGLCLDPMLDVAAIAEKTGLSEEAIRDGLLDLTDARLLRDMGRNCYGSEDGLFAEFDGAFMDWNPKEDMLVVARAVVNSGNESTSTQILADQLEWPARRINAALYALAEAKLAELDKVVASHPWCCPDFRIDQRTRRYVRENS